MGTALNTLVANPSLVTSRHIHLDQPASSGPTASAASRDINENLIPGGDREYNALDFSFTHRVSNSLTLMATYTFSKFLDNIGGPTTWANTSGAFFEIFETCTTWRLKNALIPTTLPTVSFSATCMNSRWDKAESMVTV